MQAFEGMGLGTDDAAKDVAAQEQAHLYGNMKRHLMKDKMRSASLHDMLHQSWKTG